MRQFFGYIRVSTVKQGEHGVSLQEQREAIARYASRHQITIARWFEEQETAAKRGRPVFTEMLRLLRKGKAEGVVIHKVDRSARNLRDWADVGELIDQGIDFHFATESLDLTSRSGRLSADILAVIAADYVRNLREEIKKGFYGRIKQGVLPLPAPVGYLDQGAGKPKTIDPVKGPLVRTAFELYATGRYGLNDLVPEMARRGLRNRRDRPVTRNGMSVLLNNPFYVGLIRLKKTRETFPGGHAALIPTALFEDVQRLLDGKTVSREIKHAFRYRRLFRCATCRYSVIGESCKGRVYYRCHTPTCPTTSMREDAVTAALERAVEPLAIAEDEWAYILPQLPKLREQWLGRRENEREAIQAQLGQVNDRLARLTDAYVDRLVEKPVFEERREALLIERRKTEERLQACDSDGRGTEARVRNFLELAGRASVLLKTADPDEARDLVTTVTSNRAAHGKSLEITLFPEFQALAERWKNTYGSSQRDVARTWDQVLPALFKWFYEHPEVKPTSASVRERVDTEGALRYTYPRINE